MLLIQQTTTTTTKNPKTNWSFVLLPIILVVVGFVITYRNTKLPPRDPGGPRGSGKCDPKEISNISTEWINFASGTFEEHFEEAWASKVFCQELKESGLCVLCQKEIKEKVINDWEKEFLKRTYKKGQGPPDLKKMKPHNYLPCEYCKKNHW